MNYVTKKAREGVTYGIAGHSIFTHAFGRSRPVYDAPREGGAGDPPADPPTPQDPPANDPPADPPADPTKPKPTDAEARLLKDVMKHKTAAQAAQERLALFGDVTPEQVQEMLTARREAEAKRVKDEEDAALARGEFDRVKASIVEQHTAALTAKDTQLTEKDTALAAAQSTISELTVGTAFGNSSFIREKLVLTPAKARTVYGTHFDTVGTQVVGYNKPRGAAERTPLVDAAGKNLAFEAAIEKLVNDDPDKDHLLRGKMPTGAKSNTTDDTKTDKHNGNAPEVKGVSRIAAALAAKKAALAS